MKIPATDRISGWQETDSFWSLIGFGYGFTRQEVTNSSTRMTLGIRKKHVNSYI